MNELTIRTRLYRPTDAKDLAQIFYNTIHKVNSKDYTPEQNEAWAPLNTLLNIGKGNGINLVL